VIVNHEKETARDRNGTPDVAALWESPEEAIREARDVVLQLSRTVNTRRIHLPNNPTYRKFLDELNAKLQKYVAKRGTFVLGVYRFEFQYEGEPIYNDSNQGDSLPFRLYKDGLSELAFHSGVTEEELRDFVETIYRSYEVTAEEDDLVTLLWEQHFQHISYEVIDEPLQGESSPEPPPVATPETRVARPASPPAQDVKPEVPLPRESYVLTEQEVEKLRKEMAVEAGWDMGFQLVDLIYEVLAVREEMDDYPLALDVMERVIGHFVRRGSFGHAARTLKAFRELEENSAALPERHRALLSQAVQRMGDADRIQEIGGTLNRGLDSEMAELETYLRFLPRRAVEPLMDLLGEVKHRKGRRVLCEVLVDLLGSNLEPLAKRLDDPRWFVVRNLIYILHRSGSRNGLKYLRQTLSHPHPKVRQETLRALEAMGMARSADFLLGLLESRDEICRTWALERLAVLGDRRAAEPLWKLIRTRGFRDQSWHDKRAYFEALGRCAPPEMLPAVKALFEKRGWFERPKDLEVRAGAAMALALIGGEQVISLLDKGCHAEEAVMREACRQAVNTIGRMKASAASPEEVSGQAQPDQTQMDEEET